MTTLREIEPFIKYSEIQADKFVCIEEDTDDPDRIVQFFKGERELVAKMAGMKYLGVVDTLTFGQKRSSWTLGDRRFILRGKIRIGLMIEILCNESPERLFELFGNHNISTIANMASRK